MLLQSFGQSFHSPIVLIVLGVIALGLLYILWREVRKIPAKLLTLMATAFIDMIGVLMIFPLLPFYVKKFGGNGINIFGVHLGIGILAGFTIASFAGSFSMLALFLNDRFQVTEQNIGYFFMYVGSISVFTRVLLLGRMVDWLGESRLSRLGLVLLAGGVHGMPLSHSLLMLGITVALIPLGTAFISVRNGAAVARDQPA